MVCIMRLTCFANILDSLMSISIWKSMPESKRETFFEEYPPLRKLWNTSQKKLKTAGRFRLEKL
jgi:hypothetical protein